MIPKQGVRVSVPAPVGQPGVFVKQNSWLVKYLIKYLKSME